MTRPTGPTAADRSTWSELVASGALEGLDVEDRFVGARRLTGHASTRRFYRLWSADSSTRILALYPEADAPEVVKKYVNFGASVRATMFLNLAAKASALLEGRYHVTQEDVRSMALPVLRHRVLCNYFAESDSMTVDDVLTQMLEQVSA